MSSSIAIKVKYKYINWTKEKVSQNSISFDKWTSCGLIYGKWPIRIFWKQFNFYEIFVLFCVSRINDENADAYKIFSILYGLSKYDKLKIEILYFFLNSYFHRWCSTFYLPCNYPDWRSWKYQTFSWSKIDKKPISSINFFSY